MDRADDIAEARRWLQEALNALDGEPTLNALDGALGALGSASTRLVRARKDVMEETEERMVREAEQTPGGIELFRDERFLVVDRGKRGVEVIYGIMDEGKPFRVSAGGTFERKIRDAVATGKMNQWVVYVALDLNPGDLVPLADLEAAERAAVPGP